MREIDNRTYSTIHLTDRSLQLYLTNTANLLATPINFLSFYLIITNSKREQKLFKYTLFISHLSFYISNIFYGTIASLVLLFPFPAVCSIGSIKNFISSFWLSLIWMFLFGMFGFFTFLILIVRLRIVARRNGIFDFSDRTYVLFSIFLFLYILGPLCGLWINAYYPKSVQMEFVRKYYPANLRAFDNPSFHIDISEKNQEAIIFLLFFLISSGLTIYAILYSMVVFEISKQAIFKSAKTTKNQRKVVNSMVFQITILGTTVLLSLLLQVRHAFVPPERDTRVTTALANTCLILSSIPCQMFLILSNSHYRLALFKMFGISAKQHINTTTDQKSPVLFISGRL